jgi:hypothetical protein
LDDKRIGTEEYLERLCRVFSCPHSFGLKWLSVFRQDPNILTLHAKLILTLTGKPDRRPAKPIAYSSQPLRYSLLTKCWAASELVTFKFLASH